MNIDEVQGRRDKYHLGREERLIIETAHGFIEITAARSEARIQVTMPRGLKARKGRRQGAIELDAQYLMERDGRVLPAFQLLAPVAKPNNAFALAEVDAL